MDELTAEDVVARLEQIALLPLPPEATDVTDGVEEVEDQVAARMRDDDGLRRALIVVAHRHPDPLVRDWLDGMVTPSVHLAVAQPERLYAQPGVPVSAETAPSYAALALVPWSNDHLGRRARRRAGRKPWSMATDWLHGEPQRSTALARWPEVEGRPVPFWLQVDLARAEGNVGHHEYSRIGLPAEGILQVYADPGEVADGELVRHRAVLLPAESLRDDALERPRDLEPIGPVRLRMTDTMATLPHEEEVADAAGWGPGERFDYRVLKQLLEADPYIRQPQDFAIDLGTPVRAGYRPVVPQTRSGGHLLAPRRSLAPALAALGVPAGEAFVLLDTPLGEAEPLAVEPDRPRLVVLARSDDVARGDLTDTVAMRYFGPDQPPPYAEQG